MGGVTTGQAVCFFVVVATAAVVVFVVILIALTKSNPLARLPF